jgi:hypothetical protein
VLARLRHDAVVGGHYEQHDIDAGGARHHLPHEPLVAGHVHDAHRAAARQRELRETELDGDAALLLLGEAVRVSARDRFDERRLAVIDMPGGAEDERRRAHRSRPCRVRARRAAAVTVSPMR